MNKPSYKKQAAGIVIGSIIALLLFLVPFSFNPISFSFSKLPLIGDGAWKLSECQSGITTCLSIFNLDTYLSGLTVDIFSYVLYFGTFAYAGIMILYLIGGIILGAGKGKGRKFFRTISIIAGFILFIMAIAFFTYTIGTLVSTVETATLNETKLKVAILNYNFVLFGLVGTILCIVMAIKSFKWFYKEF